jgi:hypothetical protein
MEVEFFLQAGTHVCFAATVRWKRINTGVIPRFCYDVTWCLECVAYMQYRDVVMDFGKAHVHSSSRTFDEGFLTVHGEMLNYAHAPKVPGWAVRSTNGAKEIKEVAEAMHERCDVIERRPTFVLSNDDIFNLGHYYNDVMGIWGMLTMAGVDSKQAVLLNIDGLRAGGPAGVGTHRIMVPGKPDEHGPYIGYFKSWFADIHKAVDFGTKKVCYKELYLPPMPGVPWFWNDWGQVNDCSVQAPSPLYQSYNLFMRGHWKAVYGAASLPNPPADVVHVVIEVRAINPNKRNNHSSARHIANLAALIEALQKIPGVKVTAQDFAKISFEQQVMFSPLYSCLSPPLTLCAVFASVRVHRRWRYHTPPACLSPCTALARRTSSTPRWGSPTAARSWNCSRTPALNCMPRRVTAIWRACWASTTGGTSQVRE